MSEPPAEETPSNPSFQQALAHAHAGPPPSSEPPAGDLPDDVIRFKRSRFYAALLPVAFVTGLAAGFLIWGRGGTNAGAGPNTAAIATPQRLQVSADDDPYLGPAGAAVTIVEFSDFNCPYCRQFEQTTFPELMRAYPDKIRFVYRDFPVTSQESYYAAQAAECAGDQGAYWPFHDALLSGQYQLGRAAYEQIANNLKLNSQALLACLDSSKYGSEVQADARDGANLGVTGTPTFFINGLPLVGAQPLTQFTRLIDSELE